MLHPNLTRILGAATLAAAPLQAFDRPPTIELKALSSVTAITPGVSAAEIVAHDPAKQRIFVVNAAAAKIDVYDIRNPAQPKPLLQLDVTPFGAVANSVAVDGGILAVAVEAVVRTDPGKVVFFDSELRFLVAAEVGAVPDMVTFTPDGKYLLVANEGEPSLDYLIDPKGSVSVIEVIRATRFKPFSIKVRTAGFEAFNNAVLDPSIRIFGPDKSPLAPPGAVALPERDIEPEYLAVSADSRTAYVTCQENNAMAVVDIPSATVKKLIGLGFKDHGAGDPTAVFSFDPAGLPPIGTTIGGQVLKLGGFSGLHYEGINRRTGRQMFVTHTDRGPNAEPTGIFRPFLLPDFTPEIVRFEVDLWRRKLILTERLPLQRAPGQPLTGLPNTEIVLDPPAADPTLTPYNDEVPVNLKGEVIEPLDPFGADLEGVAVDPSDQSFWMCDEYRPALYHFDKQGVLIQRFVPIGTAAAAGQPDGTFGSEVLPAVLAQRRQNRGFEGIALHDGKIYAFVQSPLRNPPTLTNATLNGLTNVRLVEFDPVTEATRQFVYILDNQNLTGTGNTRPDKIGDMAVLPSGEFLAVERDDDSVPGDTTPFIEKTIYRFNLEGATDISGFDAGTVGATGKTVDQLSLTEMVLNDIRPISKVLHVDLNAAGYNTVQKVEGLTVIDEQTLAVINDNDFGVAGITINTADGTFTLNADYTPEPVRLGIIHLGRSTRLDASDRDGIPARNPANPTGTLTTGKINIRQWPVLGMYLPDGIAAFQQNRQTYLVLANEGDAREYVFKDANGADVVAFDEQARVGSLTLDPVTFPNSSFLKNNTNLGRLRVTSTLGWKPAAPPATGRVYDTLYSFGTRSFSIRDTAGNLVFDSGDDFERIIAQLDPEAFNTSNENNTFDDRSDDKGPEPEGVAIGEVRARTFAFICLERIGGLMVYDITRPWIPKFVQYINNRDFSQPTNTPAAGDLGPEGLHFIPARFSPTREPLLVVANEISGTTTIYEIAAVRCTYDDQDAWGDE